MRSVFALGLALASVLGACGASASSSPSNDLAITLSEFKFAPANPALTSGQPVRLSVKNVGSVEHDVTIAAANVHLVVKPGQTATKEIAPLAAGTYDIVCSVAGHREAGMVAKLTVK
jgi:uncharacterized cupredoxin-like copper-binding protein